MIKIFRLILILLLNLASMESTAKSITILDEARKPLPGAYASLINAVDSTIYDVAVSDAEGMVNFSSKPEAKCDIYVKCLGYKPFKGAFSDELAEVVLEDDATELGEVVVKGSIPTLRRSAGKYTFDPASLKDEVRNGFEILKLTPLLEVTDNSFTIINKGNSKVYINGRDPHMSDLSIIEMLKSLRPEQLKKVEIITTPGSSQSASFSGGVINIIIDRPDQGYRGSVSSRARYMNKRVSPFATTWNAITHEKFNLSFFAGYEGNGEHNSTKTTYTYNDFNRTITNKDTYSSWQDNIYGQLNAQYNFSTKSTLGIALHIGSSASKSTSNITSTTIENNIETYSKYRITNHTPWLKPFYGIHGYYTLKTDEKGSYLDVTAAYGNNFSQNEISYHFPENPEQQQTKANYTAANLKPNFRWVISKNHTLNMGYELYRSETDNNFSAQENSNHFTYNELLNCGYVQWSALWSNAFSSQLGIRVENCHTKSNLQTTGETSRRKHTDLFPSLSFSLNLPGGGNQNISFDISRYISRPRYALLNPFVIWTSETTCSRGNINLRPYNTWSLSLNYSFLNDFILGLIYSSSNHKYKNFTFREQDITVSSLDNFGSEKFFIPYINYYKQFFGIWRLSSNLSFIFNDEKAWIGETDLSKKWVLCTFSLSNNFILSKSKGLQLSVNYHYTSDSKSISGNAKSKNDIYLSISKWFDNGINMSFDIHNPLGNKNDLNFYTNEYSYSQHSSMYPIQFIFKFNYTFGKKRVRGATDRYESPLTGRLK